MSTTDMNAPPEHKESLWLLIVSPTIWAVHFLLSYISAAIWCAKFASRYDSIEPVRWAIVFYTAVALLGIHGGSAAWHRVERAQWIAAASIRIGVAPARLRHAGRSAPLPRIRDGVARRVERRGDRFRRVRGAVFRRLPMKTEATRSLRVRRSSQKASRGSQRELRRNSECGPESHGRRWQTKQ
jgi:hypothetical protein